MQLLQILNNQSANIMRVSTAGSMGFTDFEMEAILSCSLLYNFQYYQYTIYDEWKMLISTLQPNHVILAGYTKDNGSEHVFLIGCQHNRNIVYIDFQNPEGSIVNYNDGYFNRFVRWKLLFRSYEQLQPEQLQDIISIIPEYKQIEVNTHDELQQQYDDLKEEYDDLRQEYGELQQQYHELQQQYHNMDI
jgi:FtsZ-binding cell division protein ZapB